MRIAVIAAAPIPSRRANSLQVMKTCGSLAQLGHAVHLYVPGTASRMAAEEISAHYGLRAVFPITWLPAWGPLRNYDFSWRAVHAARRWRADLLFVRPLQAAALAARLGWPTLLDLHDRPHGRFGPRLFRWFVTGRGARRLLTTTRALRNWLEQGLGMRLPDTFVRVAPNGVDLESYAGLPAPPRHAASSVYRRDSPQATPGSSTRDAGWICCSSWRAGTRSWVSPGRGAIQKLSIAGAHAWQRPVWRIRSCWASSRMSGCRCCTPQVISC